MKLIFIRGTVATSLFGFLAAIMTFAETSVLQAQELSPIPEPAAATNSAPLEPTVSATDSPSSESTASATNTAPIEPATAAANTAPLDLTAPATHSVPSAPIASATNSAPAAPPVAVSGVASSQPVASEAQMISDSYQDLSAGKIDAALDKVNNVIKLDSQNKSAFLLRAFIYAQEKQWDKADSDYQMVLVVDPNNATVKFDQAEIKFIQKKYDDARPGFLQVQNDEDLGDIATYKVFLCDLFGSHEDRAAKELEAINQIGGNPSYYFANAAWDLVHKDNQAAAGWLKSAAYIYAGAPQKISNYSSSLRSLGYLPLRLTSVR